jgi:hypothetical protein
MFLLGVLNAVKKADIREKNKALLQKFKTSVQHRYNEILANTDDERWLRLLEMINS